MDVNKEAHKLKSNKDKTAKIDYIPHKYSITIISKCNLRCPTCVYLLQDRNHFRDKGFMAVEDYRNMLIKFKRHIDILTLTGGEALMHPHMEELIDIAESLNISVGFSTNGILIKNNLEICRKVNGFRISLDAYDSKTYKKNRGGTEKQWNDILEGIELLKNNNIKFDISFLISKSNLQEIDAMFELTDKIQPGWVNFNSLNPHGNAAGSVLLKSDNDVEKTFTHIMNKTDYDYDITLPYVFDDQSEYFKRKVCNYPWVQVCVQENGHIAYCCHTRHNQSIGNIFEDYEFNSPKMQNWRQLLLKSKMPKECVYCHRRFQGDYITFDKDSRAWKPIIVEQT